VVLPLFLPCRADHTPKTTEDCFDVFNKGETTMANSNEFNGAGSVMGALNRVADAKHGSPAQVMSKPNQPSTQGYTGTTGSGFTRCDWADPQGRHTR
jgi:hypothetical protein